MAIATISTGSLAVAVATTNGSFSLAIPDAGAHIFLAVGIDETSTQSVTANWDSSGANSSFTRIHEQNNPGLYAAMYLLANPSTGTHAIVLNGLSSGAGTRKGFVAIALSGVDSTTPYDTLTISGRSTGGSTGIASTAIPSEAGDLVLSMVSVDGGVAASILPDSSGTLIGRSLNLDGTIQACMASWPGAATVLSSWAMGLSASANSLIALNVNASGAAPATASYRRVRTMLGTGL